MIARATSGPARALALSFAFFRAALLAQHRRTLLGYLWLFLPATVAAIAASYVRSRGLLSFATPGLPYPVFVFGGTVLWQVFLETLNAPLSQLSANRALVTRLNFPHEGLILAGVWLALLNAAIRLIALLGLCAALGVALSQSALLIPLGIACLALLGLALGLLLAPLGMLYDDVGRGLTIVTGVLFFLMPIAYPLTGDGWQAFNPVLAVINAARGWLTGAAPVSALLAPTALGLGLLCLSWPLYRIAQPHVLERLG